MGKHGRHGRVTGTAKNKGQAKMKKKIVKMRSDGGRTQLKHDRKAGIPSGRGISGSSCSGNGGAPKGMEYSASQSILLLGEGDFSFAAALALLWGDASNLVATGFDDEETARDVAPLPKRIDLLRPTTRVRPGRSARLPLMFGLCTSRSKCASHTTFGCNSKHY